MFYLSVQDLIGIIQSHVQTPHCPKSNPNFRDITQNVEKEKRDTSLKIPHSISFPPLHFVLYLGKMIIFGTVQVSGKPEGFKLLVAVNIWCCTMHISSQFSINCGQFRSLQRGIWAENLWWVRWGAVCHNAWHGAGGEGRDRNGDDSESRLTTWQNNRFFVQYIQ